MFLSSTMMHAAVWLKWHLCVLNYMLAVKSEKFGGLVPCVIFNDLVLYCRVIAGHIAVGTM